MDEIVIEDDTRRPPRTWDFLLTVALIVVLLVVVAVLVFAGLALSVGSLGCGDTAGACNGTVFSIGVLLATAGVGLVALAGVITAIVFIARRRISFTVPLVTILVVVGLFALGSWLARLAVP